VATFAPRAEKDINFNVAARVRSKPTPLSLNVKGEGYALRSALLLEMADGALTELAAQGGNPVDFGQVCGGGTVEAQGGRRAGRRAAAAPCRVYRTHCRAFDTALNPPSPPSHPPGHHQRPRRAHAAPGQLLGRQL
jgi:hypothetical protein